MTTNTYPTTPDLTIRAGDHVRSYDFPGRTDCYVEGYVEGFRELEGCQRYIIAVYCRVLEGRQVPCNHPRQYFPPVNGEATTFGGVCRGVVKTEDLS